MRADAPFWFERQAPSAGAVDEVAGSVPAASVRVVSPAAVPPAARHGPVRRAPAAPSADDAEFTRRWSENWERELDELRARRLRAPQARSEPTPTGPTRAPGGPRAPDAPRRSPPRPRSTPRRTGSAAAGRTALAATVVVLLVGAASAWLLAPGRSGAAHPPVRPVVGGSAAVGAVVAPHPAASAYAQRTIPRTWLRMYWQAGAEYGLDWTVLAAVGTLESDNGASTLPGVARGTNAAGVAGPAQFAEGTWARYSVNVDPGRRDGASRYDAADAITTMAAYLKASGAPQDWPAALYAYNHSTAYVQDVLALAARYRA